MNAPAGNGFFANIASKFPFGQSDQSNPVVQPANPNFPSKTALDPKNNNQQVQGTPATDPNLDPNNNADPNKGASGSQLDNFKDLFTIPKDKDGKPIQPQADPFAEPLFKIDPAALQAAASKANFTAGITQEQLQAAQADPQAMLQLMNKVAQNGFLGAVQSLTGVVENAVTRNNERFEKALPDRIRATQINQAQSKHPALSHPAAKPIVEALKLQVAATNPHLTPEQVAAHAENYVISLSKDVNTHDLQLEAANKPKQPGEVDWSILG